MANIDPYDVNERVSIAQTEFDNIYKTHRNNRITHKSLDFSNVNMPDDAYGNRNDFRKFHQTRIFVQKFGGMQAHGQNQNSGTFMITANLPKSISYNLQSEWSTPLNIMQNEYLNMAAQFVSPKIGLGDKVPSMFNRATTVQVWKGTNPLELTLKIPVIDDGVTDSRTNLVEALEFLGSLVLPGQGSKLGFLSPPPSPVSLSVKYSEKDNPVVFSNVSYGRITVLLGGILLLDNMIMKRIEVNYPNTANMIRHNYVKVPGAVGSGVGQQYLTPLLAEVTIVIQTVEAITKQAYSKMLWLKPQADMGQFEIDLPAAAHAVGEIGSKAVNGMKDIGSALGGAVMDNLQHR